MNVNAVSSTETKSICILCQTKDQRKQPRTLRKLSQMPAGLFAKMMASKKRCSDRSKKGKFKGYFIYDTRMTTIDKSHCDSLIPEVQFEDQICKEIYCKVNISKQDMIV